MKNIKKHSVTLCGAKIGRGEKFSVTKNAIFIFFQFLYVSFLKEYVIDAVQICCKYTVERPDNRLRPKHEEVILATVGLVGDYLFLI